ncbi:MAG: hypothetical protein ACTS73_07120 [Arsenophonus sp. NEOnobi-MAG3]
MAYTLLSDKIIALHGGHIVSVTEHGLKELIAIKMLIKSQKLT